MLDCRCDPALCYVLDCWEEPSLSPGVLKRTLSHIWLRLYLPISWLSVGFFYPYEDGFLDGPGLPLVLPAYDVEAGVCSGVSCLLYVCIDG